MNDINTLRGHLFDAINRVKNGSISIEQAKAVSDLSQTIINSAKVEVDFCRITGKDPSTNFIAKEQNQAKLPKGVVSARTHVLKG